MPKLIMSTEMIAKKKGMTVEEYRDSINKKPSNIQSFDLMKLSMELARKIITESVNFAMNELSLGMIPQIAELVNDQPGGKYLKSITVGMMKKLIGNMIDGDPNEKAQNALAKSIAKDLQEIHNGTKKERVYECKKVNSKIKFSVNAWGGIAFNVNKLVEGYGFPFDTFKIGGFEIPKFTVGIAFTIRL
jgi:hypothetical protein